MSHHQVVAKHGTNKASTSSLAVLELQKS